MNHINPLCRQCKCLDTTSLTKSGHVCLVGKDIESMANCKLLLRRIPAVDKMVKCVKTLKKDGLIVANASDVCVIRLFPDDISYVTQPENAAAICKASGDEFETHFEEQKLINANWVKLDASGTLGRHRDCGSPVYEDSGANRHCIDKNCMGSYYGINLMDELVRA